MAAVSSQTFSRLISPSRNSNTCKIRKLIRRPCPGSPSMEPITAPVISCSRIIESPAKYRCSTSSDSVRKLAVSSS